ncbi:MAG: hypothetical protein HY981_00110 [Candidatus Magasanikbacteria bacterium]|nr:hypothetical protein [Candidatus Magasanikbacteria bacterium]
MLQLSTNEVYFFKELREAGVLEDVNGNRLNTSHGVILVTCADGDQMGDIFTLQSGMTDRIHTLALNGGGLLLPLNSPANTIVAIAASGRFIRVGDVYMDQIKAGMTLKVIKTVALHVHFPCGIAQLYNIPPLRLIDLLVQAKTRIKDECANIKVAAYVHIAWPDCRKRTYFISRDKWSAYCNSLLVAA